MDVVIEYASVGRQYITPEIHKYNAKEMLNGLKF